MNRTEKDMLGTQSVPQEAYWGIHTCRAKGNFKVSRLRHSQTLMRAWAMVKKSAALANRQLGYLDDSKAEAILQACDEIIEDRLADQFDLDALQGGAGTSLNMNMNEVVANRALEIMGRDRGDYVALHPIEDVNLHQSTNDTFPTALRIAVIFQLRQLSESITGLQGAFQHKEKEFASVIKMGVTELQESVPMTLGIEFSGFAEALARDRWRTFKCEERLRTVNLGGTAVGTGLGAPRRYIFLAIEKLREVSGLGLSRAENMVEATAHSDPFVEVSGILKTHASNLIKISNDLRYLAFRQEISLPPMQAGSSIMPGKVNPVIMESAIQAGLKVIANDHLVTESASRSTGQINEFLPLLAYALMESLEILDNVNLMLAPHIEGIQARPEICARAVHESVMIMTAFLPHIGYDRAGALMNEFGQDKETSVKDFLVSRLGSDLVERVLDPAQLNALGHRDEPNT